MALGWAEKGCPVSRSWRETTMSLWVWLPPHRAVRATRAPRQLRTRTQVTHGREQCWQVSSGLCPRTSARRATTVDP